MYTAIITGASKGIGKATALKLAQRGFNLALIARNEDKLIETGNEIQQYGIFPLLIPADLMLPGSIEKIITTVVSKFGGFDILINNAGIATPNPISETTEQQWDELMTLNAKVPFFLSKAAIPYLAESQRGTIINISSVVGHKGYVNQAAYSASKHALTGFTKVLSQEVKPLGIRVHIIAPGGVATEMITSMRPDINAASLIQPEEIANIVDFLLHTTGNSMIDEINIRRYDSSIL